MSIDHPYGWNRFAAAAASFVGFAGFTLVMPFLPLYFQELGVREVGEIAVWSGLSLGVTPAVTAVLSPVWGRFGDRFGLKIMVERSLLSFVVIMSAMAFVTQAWHVFALRTVQGLFAGFGALTLTMAAESAPRDRLAASIGMVQTAQRLGPALGPVIGGTIAQIVGLRKAFLVAAGFYAIALLVVAILYREPEDARRRTRAVAAGARRVTFRGVLGFQHFLLLMAVVFSLQVVDRSFGPILPLFVAQLGAPMSRVPILSGIAFSLVAGAAAAGHHVAGRLLGRWAPRSVIATSCAFAAGAVLAVGLTPSLGGLMGMAPVFGLGVGVAMTGAYAVAGSVIPAGVRGTGFGVLTTASLSGIALSPILSGALGAISIRAVFLLDAVGLAVLSWFVARWMVLRPEAPDTTLPGQ
jgi:DHA1 family multidrug resistance protein-like MFS transporter